MKRVAILTILALAAVLRCPGAEYSYICETSGCAFGRTSDESLFARPPLEIGFYDYEGHIGGYCYACKKFVTIRWKSAAIPRDVSTNLPYAPPRKLAIVLIPFTANELNLYACPDCTHPFVEVDESSIQETGGKKLIFCPRCSKRSLRLLDRLRFP